MLGLDVGDTDYRPRAGGEGIWLVTSLLRGMAGACASIHAACLGVCYVSAASTVRVFIIKKHQGPQEGSSGPRHVWPCLASSVAKGSRGCVLRGEKVNSASGHGGAILSSIGTLCRWTQGPGQWAIIGSEKPEVMRSKLRVQRVSRPHVIRTVSYQWSSASNFTRTLNSPLLAKILTRTVDNKRVRCPG